MRKGRQKRKKKGNDIWKKKDNMGSKKEEIEDGEDMDGEGI